MTLNNLQCIKIVFVPVYGKDNFVQHKYIALDFLLSICLGGSSILSPLLCLAGSSFPSPLCLDNFSILLLLCRGVQFIKQWQWVSEDGRKQTTRWKNSCKKVLLEGCDVEIMVDLRLSLSGSSWAKVQRKVKSEFTIVLKPVMPNIIRFEEITEMVEKATKESCKVLMLEEHAF